MAIGKLSLQLLVAMACLLLARASSMWCPEECSCEWQQSVINIDCSDRWLTKLPNFNGLPINVLNLAGNYIGEFPSSLSTISTLVKLDLSNNNIQRLSPGALDGFDLLRTLYLNKNNFTDWLEISPSEVFQPAKNLQFLSLAGNFLHTLSSEDSRSLIVSDSLTTLDLTDAFITTISGNSVLQGLPKLENLILNQNKLSLVTPFASASLKNLEMAYCKLPNLPIDMFSQMPNLVSLDLSGNDRISLHRKLGKTFVHSESVRRINLSSCSLHSVQLSGFPSLTYIILRNNFLSKLTDDSFYENRLVERLDLSMNNIQIIDSWIFESLSHLQHFNLSFNIIARVPYRTFEHNKMLTTLDLSKNPITKFGKLLAKSLVDLNLSGCEILSIDESILSEMPQILELDLSNNVITTFPQGLTSDTLQTLNLGMCRLSSIQNNTFANLPKLSKLNLSGNRLTNPFHVDFFKKNKFLSEIWLADNPWICDCKSNTFLQFYEYLVDQPMKVSIYLPYFEIKDKTNLKCASPTLAYERTWENFCYATWFPYQRTMGLTEKIWTIIMISLMTLSIVSCVYFCVKRYVHKRRTAAERLQRQIDREARLTIQRHHRMREEQEAQLNTPDPRETNPPCYEDAIRMPHISKSMFDIFRSKSKDSSDEEEGNGRMPRIHPSQSEAQISTLRRQQRIRPKRRKRPSQNSHGGSLEISNFQGSENSPYSRRAAKLQGNVSFGDITNITAHRKSPYARRKPKLGSTSGTAVTSSTLPEQQTNQLPPSEPANNSSSNLPSSLQTTKSPSNHSINVVDDHFSPSSSNTDSSRSSSLCDFQMLADVSNLSSDESDFNGPTNSIFMMNKIKLNESKL